MDWSLIVDGEPAGILISDAEGTVCYANPAAVGVLGRGEGGAPLGRPVAELIGTAKATVARTLGLPSGHQVWYLAAEMLAGSDDAAFALEVGDALAGTLNVHRTLGRIVDLAVPRLGRWATVTLWENDRVRQRSCGPGSWSDDRALPARRLDDAGRRRLQWAMETPLAEILVADPDDLIAFGASRPAAEQLLSGGAVRLLTAALRAYGSPIGTLVVAPHGEEDVTSRLMNLASRAAVALNASRTYEERSRLAGTLRAALVPADLPVVPGMAVGAAYRPALEATAIGGDFYEMRQQDEGWSFSIGDVCGKGVEAAVLTGQVRQSLNAVSLLAAGPAERLELLNAALLRIDGSSFVTLLHGVIRPMPDRLALSLAGGGHPEPLIRRRDGSVETVQVAGPIIGMLPEVRFATVEVALRPGDTLICYTDGLSDARGNDGLLGAERLAAVAADSGGMAAQAIADRMLQFALEHLEGRPHDDMAVLTLQPAGSQGVNAS